MSNLKTFDNSKDFYLKSVDDLKKYDLDVITDSTRNSIGYINHPLDHYLNNLIITESVKLSNKLGIKKETQKEIVLYWIKHSKSFHNYTKILAMNDYFQLSKKEWTEFFKILEEKNHLKEVDGLDRSYFNMYLKFKKTLSFTKELEKQLFTILNPYYLNNYTETTFTIIIDKKINITLKMLKEITNPKTEKEINNFKKSINSFLLFKSKDIISLLLNEKNEKKQEIMEKVFYKYMDNSYKPILSPIIEKNIMKRLYNKKDFINKENRKTIKL